MANTLGYFALEKVALNFLTIKTVVLLAFVDANYKFVMVDIGSYGREGDSGIIEKSNLES